MYSVKKGALKDFANFKGKHLQSSDFIKKRLQNRCFIVKFEKFFRVPLFTKQLW